MSIRDALASLAKRQERNAAEYARMADEDARAGRFDRMQMYRAKSERLLQSSRFNAYHASIPHPSFHAE